MIIYNYIYIFQPRRLDLVKIEARVAARVCDTCGCLELFPGKAACARRSGAGFEVFWSVFRTAAIPAWLLVAHSLKGFCVHSLFWDQGVCTVCEGNFSWYLGRGRRWSWEECRENAVKICEEYAYVRDCEWTLLLGEWGALPISLHLQDVVAGTSELLVEEVVRKQPSPETQVGAYICTCPHNFRSPVSCNRQHVLPAGSIHILARPLLQLRTVSLMMGWRSDTTAASLGLLMAWHQLAAQSKKHDTMESWSTKLAS